MKVRIIKEDSIWNYCIKNARAKPSFYIFLEKLKNCTLYIAFIGTHAEYDKVNACYVQDY